MFIHFSETEREGREAEREGDTESKAGSSLWAVSTEPDTGLELTDYKTMTWAEVRCFIDWATQGPHVSAHFNMPIKTQKESQEKVVK